MGKNILFICGTFNQTTQMHAIARELPEHHCFFTPFYLEGFTRILHRLGLLEYTAVGGKLARNIDRYLAGQRLSVDPGGKRDDYDLVVMCTDLLVQKNLRGKRLLLVQEGMTEPEGLRYAGVRLLGLPRYLANTASFGLSNAYHRFCVASPGYRDLFIRKGIPPEKLVVTGIPNFDNVASFLKNDFPYHDYLLAATSPTRETFQRDDRWGFIQQVMEIANGRQVIFKLHPAENERRSRREIERFAPGALVMQEGNINAMIANCAVLVTQFSTVTYIGLALGKKVFSYLDLEELSRLMPVQNGGTSARLIADECRSLLAAPLRVSAAALPRTGWFTGRIQSRWLRRPRLSRLERA
ncbi:MAG TPA: hypothetical protein VMT46_11505 [Anaerolineaceae bacterium]|nr:hypothetical protein [Anaerolineaceae bacterium]